MPPPPEWSWAIFSLLLAVLWCLVLWAISWWGGWRELAEIYPGSADPSGVRFRLRSAQLRAGCSYNSCLTFVASPAGLHLSTPLPFRFAHPAIFLPWPEVRAEPGRAWLTRSVTLTAARCPGVPIRLSRSLAQRLLESAGGQLQREPPDNAPIR